MCFDQACAIENCRILFYETPTLKCKLKEAYMLLIKAKTTFL